MIKIVHRPTFPDNPNNPARCNRLTGVIEINDSVFSQLTPVQQAFWINHEKGHIIHQTPSELIADEYAHSTTAGSAPYSLRQIQKTVTDIASYSPERVNQSTRLSLEYAAQKGSQQAQEIIKFKTNIMDEETQINTVRVAGDPSANPIYVQKKIPALNHNPQLNMKDEGSLKDTQIFMNTGLQNSPLQNTPNLSTKTSSDAEPEVTHEVRQKSVSVGVTYSSEEEEIAKANASAAISDSNTKTYLIVGGIVLLLLILLATFYFSRTK